MAEVLVGSIKHDGEVFEVGFPASKLPKSVRMMARNNGLLGPAPKKAKTKDEVVTEDEPEVDDDSIREVAEVVDDEPDTEE